MSKRIGCTLILFDCQQSLKAAKREIFLGFLRFVDHTRKSAILTSQFLMFFLNIQYDYDMIFVCKHGPEHIELQ